MTEKSETFSENLKFKNIKNEDWDIFHGKHSSIRKISEDYHSLIEIKIRHNLLPRLHEAELTLTR